MVLNNVADGSGLIVETASTLDAEVLGHGNLHTLDISAVPKRLDKSVGETERQHVVDRALAQVVIDAKDVDFVEDAEQNFVQFLGRCEIVPEGFFDNDATTFATIRFRQVLHHGFEQDRRDGEVVCRALRALQFVAERGEGSWVLIVAVDVAEQVHQFVKGGGLEPTVLFQTVFGSGTKLVQIPSGFGDADDGYIQMAALHHRLQGRENFLVGQVARGPEENEGVRVGIRHENLSLSSGLFRGLLQMSAEFVAHGGEEFVGKIGLAARTEALVQGGG